MNIKQIQFPTSQYIQEEHKKVQVYLHHTAGNRYGERVFQHWATNPERIATCVTITGPGPDTIDGQIVQGFSSRFWAYHLGLKESTFQKFGLPFRSLDKISIGIEICNWGQLTWREGKFFTYVNRELPASEVMELERPFRGFRFFHNYSDKQIESTRELLLLWKDRYGINLKYNPDIWDVTKRALTGENGVFTHNSVRYDKVDIYPHPKMIAMLQSLNS